MIVAICDKHGAKLVHGNTNKRANCSSDIYKCQTAMSIARWTNGRPPAHVLFPLARLAADASVPTSWGGSHRALPKNWRAAIAFLNHL